MVLLRDPGEIRENHSPVACRNQPVGERWLGRKRFRPGTNPLFGDAAVYFGKVNPAYVECQSEEQAKLIYLLAIFGVSGDLKVPHSGEACTRLLELVNARLDTVRSRFQELAESRTSNEDMRRELLGALTRWFVMGRERRTVAADSQ